MLSLVQVPVDLTNFIVQSYVDMRARDADSARDAGVRLWRGCCRERGCLFVGSMCVDPFVSFWCWLLLLVLVVVAGVVAAAVVVVVVAGAKCNDGPSIVVHFTAVASIGTVAVFKTGGVGRCRRGHSFGAHVQSVAVGRRHVHGKKSTPQRQVLNTV